MECELHDVGHRCFLRLPSDDQVWTIGLSVTEELTGCIANLIHSSEVVVIFFSIQYRSDGHWITPYPDLPVALNGEMLQVSALLSHGSVLMVGDHTLTFTIKTTVHHASEAHTVNHSDQAPSTSSPRPPPKPARQGNTQIKSTTIPHSTAPGRVFESSSDTIGEEEEKSKKPGLLHAQHESSSKAGCDLEKSMEVFLSLKDSLVNTDVELLDHIDTPEQMSDVCSSYLFQFLLSKGFVMSAKEMDSIHQAIQVVGMDQAHTLLDFLRGVKTKDVICHQDHSTFLTLITDVLLFTMDSEVSSETCMKVLVHLIAEPDIASYLSQHGAVPIVSACSAVYPHNVRIQTMMCRIYGHVVDVHQGDVCPVKEAAIDLIIRSLGNHQNEKPFLRAALRIICALIRLHNITGKRDVRSDEVRRSDTILSHMEEHVLPVIQSVHNCVGDDAEILERCVEIMEVLLSYRGNGSYSVIDYQPESHCSDGYSLIDYQPKDHRSNSPSWTDCADILTDKPDMDVKNSYNKTKADKYVYDNADSPSDIEICDANAGGNSDASALYAKVRKTSDDIVSNTPECDQKDNILESVQFRVDSKPEPTQPVYEDVGTESVGVTEEDDIVIIDNELYEGVDFTENNEPEYIEVISGVDRNSDLENSQTESEYELTLGPTVQETVDSDDEKDEHWEVQHPLDHDTGKQVDQEDTKRPGDDNSMSNQAEKKKSAFKKKIGGYISKLKPKMKKKKQNFTEGLAFKEGMKSPIHFDEFDNNIDIAFNSSSVVIREDTIVALGDGTDSQDGSLQHLGNNPANDNSSQDSEFGLPPIPHSDTDSMDSEFRLPPDSRQLDHELSESEEEHGFCIDSEDADIKAESQYNYYTDIKLNSTEYQAGDEVPTAGDSKEDLESDDTSSSELMASTGLDIVPESRSEYSDEIAQSMENRLGKKAAWVSTLKRIYEKPASKLKNAVGVSKKVDVVANPKYDCQPIDERPAKVLLTHYQSTENLSTGGGLNEEECSETESELADGADTKHSSNRGSNRLSSKKLSKFEALKLKNQREKMKQFPWTANSKT